MAKFKVVGVKFDTDGDKALAKKLAKKYTGWVFEAESDQDADERAADIVSDDSGFCVYHVGYEPVKDMTVKVKCAVACKNSSGSPDFFITTVEVTKNEYALGDHYDKATAKAEEDGYENPFLVYEKADAPKWFWKAIPQ